MSTVKYIEERTWNLLSHNPVCRNSVVTGHLSLEVSVLLQIPMVPVLPCYISTASLGILNFSLSTGSSSSLTLFCINSVLSCHGLTFPPVVRELCYFFFFVQKSIKRYEGFYLFKKIYALKGNNTIFY